MTSNAPIQKRLEINRDINKELDDLEDRLRILIIQIENINKHCRMSCLENMDVEDIKKLIDINLIGLEDINNLHKIAPKTLN